MPQSPQNQGLPSGNSADSPQQIWPPRWRRQGMAIAALTAVIIAALLIQANPRDIAAALRSADWRLIALMIAVSAAVNVFMAADKFLRIARLIGAAMPFRESLFLRLASAPIKLIVPGKAGEAAKALYLNKKYKTGIAAGLSAVVFDKVTNLIAALVLLLTCTSWYASAILPSRYYVVALATVLLFLLFRRRPWMNIVTVKIPAKIKNPIRRLTAAFMVTGTRRRLWFTAYSVLFEGSEIINTYLALRAVGVEIPLWDAVALVPVVILIGNLPFTLAGIGAREAGVLVVYSHWGSSAQLVSAGLLISGIEYVLFSVVGVFALPRFIREVTSQRAGNNADGQLC